MPTARVFRLFVSSTFSDFIAEREALQTTVFPQLEKYCAQRGARFQAVDLRWGITEEAQREHDTMRICLEEVRRCQQLSPQPNFAVLLGDRYGWEPVPARIPQSHLKRLIETASKADRVLIKQSYQRDKNAIPPVFCLRERTEYQDAFQHEARLLQALRRAARHFRGSARLPYFASATHQEIALGALLRRDEKGRALYPEQHVHVYVRHLEGLPSNASAKDFVDWDENIDQEVLGARGRLRGLEIQLRRQLGHHVHDLHTTWSRHGRNGKVNKAYLKRFCDEFLSHQKTLIDAELDSLGQADERQQREQAHRDFGTERSRVFVGRKALLSKIARYTGLSPKGRSPQRSRNVSPVAPLVILGAGGSGKSALLASAAAERIVQRKRSSAIVLQRYIGGVPGTESLMTMLTVITADIAVLYGQPVPPVPQNTKALIEAFAAALRHANARRPLILYLDALDQLDKAQSAWMLEWLPEKLPPHVRVVASVRTGTSMEQSARRRYARSLIEVPPMKPAEGRMMLEAWLADKRAAWFNAGIAPSIGRRLTHKQQQLVLGAFNASGNGSALWLKLAYEEAATWASWDSPRELPTTIHGLIEDLIDHRLIEQENHPKVFTEKALAYLTAGRFGLSESELGRALGTDKTVREEFEANEKTQRKWRDEKHLPPILWSRLYFDLQAYLGLAQMDGARLMRWFHREFAEVLKARYLGTQEQRKTVHGALADAFQTLERELRPDETSDDALFRATDASKMQISVALRRVMEQPWQLSKAGRNEALKALLTDFGFCMGKCAANAGDDLVTDFLVAAPALEAGGTGVAWARLVREQGHLLRRGSPEWAAHKILLQVAMERADDSPVTLAAEAWLGEGHCDWFWLKKRKRPERQVRSPVLAVLEGHTETVAGADVLPDGRLMSWSDGDNSLRLWDGASGAMLAVLEGHTEPVNGAQVLPDGRLLSWSWDGTLRLWDGVSGARLAVLKGHTGSVWGALVLPDGRLLSWSLDKTLRLWDGVSGARLAVLKGHTEPVNGARILPDGRLMSWSDSENTLRLWDSATGAIVTLLEGHTDRVNGARVLPDGRLLSWSWDGTLRLWDGVSGARLAVLKGHTEPVNGARILPDGRLLSWSSDRTLRLWDGASGAMLTVLEGHTASVAGARALPDGRLLSWSADRTLRLWDGASGAMLAVLEGHKKWVSGAQVLPDGRLLSWSLDKTLRLWDGLSGAMLVELEGHTEGVRGARSLPDRRLLSWSSDNTLRLWGAVSSAMLAVLEGHTGTVAGADVLPDGRLMSWSDDDNSLRLWDGASGAMLAVLEGHTEPVNGAQVLPDGRLLSWSWDGTLRLWDGVSGARLAVLKGHTEPVNGARILPDGRLMSWSDSENTLRLWDSATGAMVTLLEGHTDRVNGARVLPDGRLLSWSWDGTLRLWDGASGAMLTVLEGHTASVAGARALPDGRLLSWSADRTLRLWDGASGAMLAVLEGHKKWVSGAQVLPDGRLLSWSLDKTWRVYDGRLLALSGDGTILMWNSATGAMLGVYPNNHWVERTSFPCPWESLTSVAGATRAEDVWFGSKPDSLYVTNRKDAWTARWHGEGLKTFAAMSNMLVVGSGRHLLFLELMRGGQRLAREP